MANQSGPTLEQQFLTAFSNAVGDLDLLKAQLPESYPAEIPDDDEALRLTVREFVSDHTDNLVGIGEVPLSPALDLYSDRYSRRAIGSVIVIEAHAQRAIEAKREAAAILAGKTITARGEQGLFISDKHGIRRRLEADPGEDKVEVTAPFWQAHPLASLIMLGSRDYFVEVPIFDMRTREQIADIEIH